MTSVSPEVENLGISLQAARQRPDHLVMSAWLEHAPFAFWLADALRPRAFVELGSHHGFSYFVFCQAVRNLGCGTKCYAVDTWRGDQHASRYGEDVYDSVKLHNRQFADFSTLIRATFDDALVHFPDKGVDLLHIDGRHFYDDVKHDFESWLPKLTDDAIVLFHDTQVRDRNFGVWKYFGELRERRPTFEFVHCQGLGVMAMGSVAPKLAPLFAADPTHGDRIRTAFAELGKPVAVAWKAKRRAKRREASWWGRLLNRLPPGN